MSPRTTGILVLLAAALAAFVYFYEVKGQDARTEAEERAKRLFADVEPNAIGWFEVTLPGSTCESCDPKTLSPANTWTPQNLAELVERLGGAGALEHRQLHQLHGGEALLAALALTPTADRAAVVGHSRVEDLGVGVPAVGAVHRGPPSGRVARLWIEVGRVGRSQTRRCGQSRCQLWRTGSRLCSNHAQM